MAGPSAAFARGAGVVPVRTAPVAAVAYGPVPDGPGEGVLTGAVDAPWVGRVHAWLAAGDTGAE